MEMANIPLVRKATLGATLAHSNAPSCNPLLLNLIEDKWTPEALEKSGSTLDALNRMAKRPPVDILFEDIAFTSNSQKDKRLILHNVSGEFRSGELTCILGPSGAGKTVLLNILAGYKTEGVSGRITVNGHARVMNVFKKLSSYIMQDDLLQPRLTVSESMEIAADLKLGKELGKPEKELIVKEILQTLRLWEQRNTRSECLSGGQSKRLSIALELVNNPPIIFLDEPTSGLDVVCIRKLVTVLRLLSRQGRTIICAIHQPSASLFSLFDHVYIVSKGKCCYQGAPSLLIPYLGEIGHMCPSTHNPADFVLETLDSKPETYAEMSELCQNGKICRKEGTKTLKGRKSDETIKKLFAEHVAKEQLQGTEFHTTFFTQFLILTKRMFVQSRRNSITLWIQLTHHLISAVFLGLIFLRVGNDGTRPIDNFKFCLSVVVFFVYTHTMIPVLLFPLEIRMLRREYFNRWYSLKAYYAALTFSSLPTMVLFGSLFLVIVYIMSGQILEGNRFVLFVICSILTAMCSDGFGLVLGTAFNSTTGAIVAASTTSPLVMVCCYGMGFGSYIETRMKILMHLCYLRHGLTGLSIALYQNRPLMDCNDSFCIYSDPRLLLRDVGMATDSYYVQIAGLLVFTLIHRLLAYLILRHRLS